MPAMAPAASPVPKKMSPRSGPLIADPTSWAIISRRNGKQAVEQIRPLGLGRNRTELARHEKILGPAKQTVLILGNLHDEQRLRF